MNVSEWIKDTAGQERYRTITTAYYRGAMGFILMYDVTNEDTFNCVQDWYVFAGRDYRRFIDWQSPIRVTQIKAYSWDNAQIILVGNKCDLEDNRAVSTERAKQLADYLSYGVDFVDVV